MRRNRAGAVGVSALLCMGWLAGCGGSDPAGVKDPTELDFAPELGVDLEQMTRTDSGLYWQDLVVGDGEEAQASSTVTVHYTGWLHNGTLIDTSIGGEPLTFGLVGLIQGWREGIPGMKVGGKRKLVIPPHLGYGSSGYGAVPPNATLVFDIELLGVG